MPGAGTRLQITAHSPAAAHLLDVTRTVSRAGQPPTGIDRIELAYLRHLLDCDTPLFGLFRTRLGYILLDRDGCRLLLERHSAPPETPIDLISSLTRRKDAARARLETLLRARACARATPNRLAAMLKSHLPHGTAYLNIGHTNLTDRTIAAVKRLAGTRIAVFLHDTIPLDHPEYQTPRARLKFERHLARAGRAADLIICNSRFTGDRVAAHLPDCRARLHVNHPGVETGPVKPPPEGAWSKTPRFIVIGTIEPRKNIDLLLDIWPEIASATGAHLLLCGRRGWLSEALFARLDQAPPHVRELPGLADAELRGLLGQSRGLLFPSHVEGFGFPAMEAAALGVPVLCTPLPPLREVLGDYPIYADARDRYLWRRKIEELAQRRRGEGGEQTTRGAITLPTWQAHFNDLFTAL